MEYNLFDIHKGFQGALRTGPRTATDDELSAYLWWLMDRQGLPRLASRELHWRTYPDGKQTFCIGATIGKEIKAADWKTKTPAQYEEGAYSILVPGYNMRRDQVTMETLDESGDVLRSSTLPAEPKKGGVIWTRDQVRAAAGPIAKTAKAKRAKAAPIPVAPAPEPIAEPALIAEPAELPAVASQPAQERESEPAPAMTADALDEAPTALVADHLQNLGASGFPVSGAQVKPIAELDPTADVMARLAAIEARLDALSAVSDVSISATAEAVEKIDIAPYSGPVAARTARDMVQAKAKRSPAHERAIRRAWAERAERQRLHAMATDLQRIVEARDSDLATAETCIRASEAREKALSVENETLLLANADWEALQHRTWSESMGHKVTSASAPC